MPTDPRPRRCLRHAGGCLQPVLLRGRVDHIDGATGELLHRYTTVHEPGGVLPIACKTRRASRCPPCAEVYRADTYQLIRAGLTGGKGIPATVADHPCVFVTLTAPSFGPVHARREKDGRVLRLPSPPESRTCPHGIRLSCAEKHARDDDRLGEPLCPDCYDYTGAVLFNACAPELWRRFTITLRRTLARQAGLTGKALAAQLRVSFAKVAEYQRRGVVHFHAIIRLDGPAGPSTRPARLGHPRPAHRRHRPGRPRRPASDSRRRQASRPGPWPGAANSTSGPITTTGDVTDTKVAAYVAKYATKAAECTGTLDRRITPADRLADLPVREHARRHIAECLRLGKLPELEDLRLAAWAHMLGFRGTGGSMDTRPAPSVPQHRQAPPAIRLLPPRRIHGRPSRRTAQPPLAGHRPGPRPGPHHWLGRRHRGPANRGNHEERPVPHRQHRRRNRAGTSRSPQAPGRGAADYVFSTAWGEPIHPDTVSSLMTTLTNTHNDQQSEPLPHARLHDLRHVHATTLLLAGVPVHVVAARLGHADPSITLRVYAHVISDQLSEAADIFARAVAATT